MRPPDAVNKKSEHPVQAPHSAQERLLPANLRWDDLNAFLTVTEIGSLRSAATMLNVSVNTVRARIARLEGSMNEVLLERSPDGVRPTAAGRRMGDLAKSMRGATMDALSHEAGYELRRPGEIRIGASEAIGSGWLTPRLLDLQQQFPELTVSLMCDYDVHSERSADLDIGLLFTLPRNPELVVSKLATLHFMPFASRGYIEQHGVPKSLDDLRNHRFIEQVAPGVNSSLLDHLIGSDRPVGFLPIRTNSSLALFWAVASGAGIAFMPTYVMGITRKLIPIDLPAQLRFDLYYYYHPEARHSPPVMAGVSWLRSVFDPDRYPWFRNDFVHPSEFNPSTHASGNVVRLFEPLIGDDLI
ncbi:LysR substrate-binding domain-containing protein [Sphingobium boeckii]|uniref:DNA-binding transcriptional LysR family regulator n=1 Tax=Sphingobium boeckii TaxID=1082345 RepID=A0A7W9AIV6_9SPHN|nr:DNA-binding transcriptional LysR family regulator [Sphingobium boeckii]